MEKCGFGDKENQNFSPRIVNGASPRTEIVKNRLKRFEKRGERREKISDDPRSGRIEGRGLAGRGVVEAKAERTEFN